MGTSQSNLELILEGRCGELVTRVFHNYTSRWLAGDSRSGGYYEEQFARLGENLSK